MRTELTTRRRVLRLTYGRYVEADRAWRRAIDESRRLGDEFLAFILGLVSAFVLRALGIIFKLSLPRSPF